MNSRIRHFLAAATTVPLVFAGSVASAGPLRTLSEPDTVIYGQVFDRSGGGTPHHLTAGTLTCVVQRESDGAEFPLSGELQPLRGGLSYRLGLPHQAVAEGVTASPGTVALSGDAVALRIRSVAINGVPAFVLPPGRPSFSTSQLLRTATHRLDFEVSAGMEDRDGDGIPDWWEDRHDLDSLSNVDAGLDPDGDGLTNRQEFLLGSDPHVADFAPSLRDVRMIYYPGIASGFYLRASDADTPADGLTYELVGAPDAGELRRRTTEAEVVVAVGESFSGADLENGRLVFVAPSGATEPDSIRVRVSDGDPDHEAAEASVFLFPYLPSGAEDARAVLRDEIASGAAESGTTTVWDVDPLQVPASIRPELLGAAEGSHRFLGSPSADQFVGGPGADQFYGGYGDDELTGGEGPDRFGVVTTSGQAGTDRITDFSLSDGDAIDLRHALSGDSANLLDYLQLSHDENGARLEIDFTGDGEGYTDATLVLEKVSLAQGLAGLWDQGALLLPEGIFPPMTVAVAAIESEAAENGPTSGSVTIRRIGDLSGPLVVGLRVTGSASNGVDYAFIASSVVIPAGEAEVSIEIKPYADAAAEAAEVVDLQILESEAYGLQGGTSSAQITIADLKPELALEILEPIATQSPLSSGVVLLTRSGVTGQSLLAKFQIGGDAESGVHYRSITPFVDLVSGTTSHLIRVDPVAGADLSEGKAVRLSLRPDPGYLIRDAAAAEVLIVPRRQTLAEWRSANYPELGDIPLEEFATREHPLRISYLEAYALDRSGGQPGFRISRAGDRAAIDYRHPAAVSDVEFQLEVSNDMNNWEPAETALDRVWSDHLPAGAVRYLGRDPFAARHELYFRLNLRLKP